MTRIAHAKEFGEVSHLAISCFSGAIASSGALPTHICTQDFPKYEMCYHYKENILSTPAKVLGTHNYLSVAETPAKSSSQIER